MKVNISSSDLADIIRRDAGEELEALIIQGLDPKSWFDADPHTALIAVAVQEGSVDCVDVLLSHEGDWTLGAAYDEDLDSPLEIAVLSGPGEILQIYLKHGIIKKYSPEFLAGAVERAADVSYVDAGLVKFLEEASDCLSAFPGSRFDDSVLSLMLQKNDAVPDSLVQRLSALRDVSHNASGRERIREGIEEALSRIEDLAANSHFTRVLGELDQLPGDLRRTGAGKALVYAARNEDWDFAKQLIDQGADCTEKLGSGTTALMYASMWGNLSMIRELLARGADLNARQKGKNGKTAAEMALKPLVVRYLEKLQEG